MCHGEKRVCERENWMAAGGAVRLANRDGSQAWASSMLWETRWGGQASRKRPFLALRSAEQNAKISRGAHGRGDPRTKCDHKQDLHNRTSKTICVCVSFFAKKQLNGSLENFIRPPRVSLSICAKYFLSESGVALSTWMHGKGCFLCDLVCMG